jgi:hypothetical protein
VIGEAIDVDPPHSGQAPIGIFAGGQQIEPPVAVDIGGGDTLARAGSVPRWHGNDIRFPPVAYRWPRQKSMTKLHQTLGAKTRRTDGRSLCVLIADVNRTLRGWFGYYRHSHYTTFKNVDGWVRMRLRSILRKRQKKRGRGRGSDHQRWPNAFFANHGLYSLKTAHEVVRQSSPR